MELTIKLPELHDYQKVIRDSSARFKVISAGRRFGKTRLLSLMAIKKAMDGGNVFWIAPSFQIADVGWRLMASLAAQIPMVDIKYGIKRINFPKGWVQVRSSDSSGGLRGDGLDLAIFDEAGHIPGLKNVWEQEVRPSLSDRIGGAVFISTPKGYNYFYDLWRMENNSKDWQSFHAPSSSNPYLLASEIQNAKDQLPALVYQQEYLAEFVNLAGAMFKREYIQVVDEVPDLIATARHWDMAVSTKTQADYSVGCKGGLDEYGNVYITDVVRGRWEFPALMKVIKQTAQADGLSCRQTVETAGTQKGLLDILMAEPDMANISISGITPLTDKVTRAQPLLARAEHGGLRLLRGSWNSSFIDEMCAFPETDHDDQVDACSGMLLSCGSPVQIFI